MGWDQGRSRQASGAGRPGGARTGAGGRRRAGAAVAGLVAALALVGAPAGAQTSADVAVVDSAFQPPEVTVQPGGTVTWTQTGSLPHSVTADDGSFDSHPDCGGASGECMGAGDTFRHTFDEPGTYAYYCRIHGGPGGVGMAGTVVVTAAEPTEEEPTSPPEQDPTSPPDEADGDAGSEDPADGGGEVTGSIDVADQTGDGTGIRVRSVTIQGADGFVVIHADDDGGPGAVLGHVAVPEGTSSDVVVPLDERLTAAATVWPMLHVDAGRAGVYEFPGPDGPVTVDGAVVMAPLAFTPAAADDAASLPRTGASAALLAVLAAAVTAAGVAAVRRRSPGDA